MPCGHMGAQREAPRTLNLGTRWGCPVTIKIQLYYLQDMSPSTHWARGWVGPKATPDMLAKKQALPMPGIEPWSCSPQPVT
jgi:hypothetical protein